MYINKYICVCVYLYVYIYIYTHGKDWKEAHQTASGLSQDKWIGIDFYFLLCNISHTTMHFKKRGREGEF